jgi:RNA polymerase sigma-70 factor (ECF subfamily)
MPDAEPQTARPAPFDEILERYGQLLRQTIAQVCPKNLGLQFDDIEQEARLRLWRALEAETEIASPASYLYRIAVTTTIDAVRRAVARREEQLRVQEAHSDDPEGPGVVRSPATEAARSPEAVAERHLLLRKVQTALAKLSDDRRRAVGLHLRGFRPPEIARMLCWTEAKARSLVYRGLEDLRRRLAAEGIDYEAE